MGYEDRYDPDEDFDRWYTIGTSNAVVNWLRSGDDVLELGCATGAMTAALVERGVKVVGIDRVGAWLERAWARGLAGVQLEQADLASFDLDRTFDHVLATNVAHEVPDLDDF